METKKSYIFSDISYKELKKITDIKQVRSQDIFETWFSFKHEISGADEEFLQKLINANRYNIDYYSEFQLQLHFFSPLINRVYFYCDNYREWFQPSLSGIINGHKISGNLDFMVASGTEEPEIPYFFIQEFKKSIPIPKHPKGQLLAQIMVAMENNKTKQMKGAYNIGKSWTFVILEKITQDKYQYHESEGFDCLKFRDLKQIYINLQAVKFMYCKKGIVNK